MLLDVAFIAVVALFTILGLFTHWIVLLCRLVALVLVWTFVRFFCDDLAVFIASRSTLAELPAYLLSLIAGILLICFLLNALGEIIAGAASRPPRRVLGGFIGAFRGALLALLLFCLLDFVPASLLDASPLLQRSVRQSYVLGVSRYLSPVQGLRFVTRIGAWREILRDEKAQIVLQDDPAFRALTNVNAFRECLDDPAVQDLVRQKKFIRLLADPKVQAFLADPQARRLLDTLDPDAVLLRARQTPAPPKPPKP